MARAPLYLLTAAWAWISIFIFASVVTAESNTCSAVRSEYLRQGFKDEVPEYPMPGDHLKFCTSENKEQPEQTTCCTSVMEHKLSVQSRQDFDTKLKKLLNPFANLLDKKQKKFDELFINLLNFSQRNFDEMFTKTYGLMYIQNSYIFTDLFKTFEGYYSKGEHDMTKEMEKFFSKLYEKLFTVYNSQYIFSEDYLTCVNNHMEELKPFGEHPQKLTTNIKRSFVAFRAFVQGLDTGSSVVRNVLKVNPGVDCLHELMKMSHCSTCAGHQGVKPCMPYCLHVQELCLSHHLPLAELWPEFVDAMQKLGDRLEGPFNIGHEVPPINLKISDAIMIFQESGFEISKKVFQGCGQPHLGRAARSTRGELNLETLDFSPSTNNADDVLRRHDEAITKLIREIKTKVKNSRNFWSELPSEMCKEARHHGASSCWTGTELGKYGGQPILNLSKSTHSSDMDEQIFKLKLITNKLKEAYHGRDVSWMDEEWLGGTKASKAEPQDDEGYEGSGSGWVDSSVPQVTPTGGAQYPPDDEDGYVAREGSGFETEAESSEGSGMDVYAKPEYPHRAHEPPYNPYDIVPPPHQPPRKGHTPPQRENPSASPAEKPMSLTWAVAVYLLPAVFTFLGTIG